MREKALKAEKKPPLYVASCSFGKDSIATILLALEHKEPLDLVIFSEVMFCHKRGISGEQPEHIKWIYETAIPKLESMGVKVEVLRDERDFCSMFFHKATKGKRIGRPLGFPMAGKCAINSEVKIRPIKRWLKSKSQEFEIHQYIGIALDEEKRLERMHKYPDKISLLEKYRYTEDDAYRLCTEYGLLSPLYQRFSRGGVLVLPKC